MYFQEAEMTSTRTTMRRSQKLLVALAATLLVTITSLTGSASGDPLPGGPARSSSPPQGGGGGGTNSFPSSSSSSSSVNPSDDDDFMRNVTDQVQDLVNKLGQPSVLAFLPQSVKITLARQQREKYDKQISVFISLPRNVQERILVQILARNEAAAKIVTDNQDVLKELGFNFDYKLMVAKAAALRKSQQ